MAAVAPRSGVGVEVAIGVGEGVSGGDKRVGVGGIRVGVALGSCSGGSVGVGVLPSGCTVKVAVWVGVGVEVGSGTNP